MKRNHWTVGCAALIVAGIGGLVVAAPKPDDAVEYRQGVMMAVGWNIGTLGAMVKGDAPFDNEKFAFLAGRAAVLAPMAMEAFTPDTADTKSHAKPALWENLDDFKKRMKDMETATAKLAEIAKAGDEAAMKTEFGETVKVCKGCHDEYKEKD
jgi:cytochrome c556